MNKNNWLKFIVIGLILLVGAIVDYYFLRKSGYDLRNYASPVYYFICLIFFVSSLVFLTKGVNVYFEHYYQKRIQKLFMKQFFPSGVTCITQKETYSQIVKVKVRHDQIVKIYFDEYNYVELLNLEDKKN